MDEENSNVENILIRSEVEGQAYEVCFRMNFEDLKNFH